MCFSATGSFGVAAVIAGIGAVAAAQKKPPSHRMLAAVPLMFAGQQVAEGLVWLTIGDPSERPMNLAAVAVFLVFALVVWPLWVPLSLLKAERKPRRRRALGVLAVCGGAVATYAAIDLLRGRPTAHVSGHSIAYTYGTHAPALVLALYLPAYVIPSIVPFFVSSVSKAKTMGVVLAVALAATFVLQRQALASVWCFFAAILSVFIVLGIGKDHRLAFKIA
jgi:hypothetical protein